MTDPVSIVTGTFKRRSFLENLKKIVIRQDYPHHLIEWIIIDDSPHSNADLFPEADLDGIKVRYYYFHRKVPLAIKRNHLNHQATGKYIINMDDDDYYPPCRVSHAVATLKGTNVDIVGNSTMFMYFTNDKKIYKLGPYGENHGTAATLAYTKEYTKTHDFGNSNFAEEQVFTCAWQSKLAQLDPMKSVLALSHSYNTIDKTMFLEGKYGQLGNTINETTLTLNDFIDDREIAEFYGALSYEKQPQDPEVIAKMEKIVLDNSNKYHTCMLQKMFQTISQLT
jgi:glycosyltransferase involved in cell wall biosynthesis